MGGDSSSKTQRSPLTSVPTWRKAPRDEKNKRYLDFKQFRLSENLESSQSFVSVICCDHSWTPLTRLPGELCSHHRRRAWFAESLISWRNKTLLPQHYYQVFTVVENYKTSLSEPLSPSGLLRSHRQPCGCRVAQIHVVSAHWLIPLVKSQTLHDYLQCKFFLRNPLS
jgi:hypothetical protein